MKRSNTLFVAVVALTLSLGWGCSKKEGTPDNKQRIDYISVDEKATLDGQPLYQYDSIKAEKWNWAGNELYRIDYRYSVTYSENIYYDNKDRIVRTTIPAYRQRNDFYYDGRQLDRIETFVADTLSTVLIFVHTDGTLTQIDRVDYNINQTPNTSTSQQLNNSTLSRLMGNDIAAALDVAASRRFAKSKAKTSTISYKLEWDDDDNLTHIAYNAADGEEHIYITYDDKRNPYSELYTSYNLDQTLFGFAMLSPHNVLTIRMPYGVHQELLFSYTYQYTDDYPTQRKLHYSYTTSTSVTDWSEALFEYNRTENFYYR